MTDTRELKPCPFCGEQPEGALYRNSRYAVYCACNAAGPSMWTGGYLIGEVVERAKTEAIEAWNRRIEQTLAAVPDEVEGLAKRARKRCENGRVFHADRQLIGELADAICAQAALIAEMRKALEPFAARAGLLDGKWQDHETHWSPAYGSTEITIGDLRAARRALNAGGGDGN